MNGAAVERARPDLADERGQAVDADAVDGGAAHDREDARRGDAVGEGGLELLGRGHLALEIALHHLVVGDDDALDERLADAVLELGHVVGDRPGRRLGAVRR